MKKKNNKLPIGFIFIRWAFKNLEKTLPWLANRWAMKLFFTPLHFPEPEAEKKIYALGPNAKPKGDPRVKEVLDLLKKSD